MARVVKKRIPDPPPTSLLAALVEKHLEDLRVRNYSEYTVKNRRVHLGFFLVWCRRARLTEPSEVTRTVLEDYQRHVFHYRKKNGEPLSFTRPARPPGAAAGVVQVDGAAASHPAQPGLRAGTAAARACACRSRADGARKPSRSSSSRTSTTRWACATAPSWRRCTRPACGGWNWST